MVDILQHEILHFPIGSRQKCGVHRPAIDQDEHVAGQTASETADANGPFIAVDACDFYAGGKPQRLRNAGCAGTLNVLLRDHINRSRSFPDLCSFFRRPGDFHVAKLFQSELFERILCSPLGCVYVTASAARTGNGKKKNGGEKTTREPGVEMPAAGQRAREHYHDHADVLRADF